VDAKCNCIPVQRQHHSTSPANSLPQCTVVCSAECLNSCIECSGWGSWTHMTCANIIGEMQMKFLPRHVKFFCTSYCVTSDGKFNYAASLKRSVPLVTAEQLYKVLSNFLLFLLAEYRPTVIVTLAVPRLSDRRRATMHNIFCRHPCVCMSSVCL